MRTSRSGQAMIEMAIGMLVFTLILGALLSLGAIIPESIHLQNMVRKLAGREAQGNIDGDVDGTPLPNLTAVLSEPELQPIATDGFFTDQSLRPFEFREKTLSFVVELDPDAARWYWDGDTKFRGQESCYMPSMVIPEFSGGDVLK